MIKQLTIICLLFFINFGLLAQKTADENLAKGNSLAFNQSKYQAAIPYYEKAATLYKQQTKLKNHYRCKYLIASCLNKLSKFDESLKLSQKTLDELVKTLGEKTQIEGDIYIEMGYGYLRKAKFAKAKEYLEKAISILEEKQGKITTLPTAYNHLGRVYISLGNLDKAGDYHQKSLKLRKRYFDEGSNNLAVGYTNMADLSFYKSNYKQSIEYDKQALKIYQKNFKGNHVRVALSFNNIASTYATMGDYDQALIFQLKALKMRKALFGENHLDVGQSYYNLGFIYHRKRSVDLAIEYYKRYEKLLNKMVGKNHPNLGYIYISLANIYYYSKRTEKAIAYCKKNLDLLKKNYPKENLLFANAYLAFGTAYCFGGEFDKAIENTQKSIEVVKKVYKKPHAYVGQAYLNLARTYDSLGKYELVLKNYNLAYQEFQKVFAKKSMYVSFSALAIGRTYTRLKKYEKAAPYLQKALVYRVPQFNDSTNIFALPKGDVTISDPYLLDLLRYRASSFYQWYLATKDQKYLRHVLDIYQLSYGLINKMRDNFSKVVDELDFSKSIINYKTGALQAYYTQYQLSKDEQYLDYMLRYSEQFNANTLKKSLEKLSALNFSNIPPKLLKQELNIRSDVTYWENKITGNPQKVGQFQDSLFKYNRRYEAFITKLEKDYPKYAQLKYQSKTVSIADVQQKLDEQTVVLEYLFDQEQSYVMLITKNKVKVLNIAGNKKLTPLMNAYYEALINESKVKAFASVSYKLYEALLKPAEKYLKNKSRLLVIAPSLESIPFEALIFQKASEKAVKNNDFSGLNYLVKKYQISYHYSATLWHRGITVQKKSTPRLLAMAPFSTGKSEVVSTRSRKASDPLPESGLEVKKLFNLFQSKKLAADIYLAKKATKALFVEKAKDYSILHIASHSEANTKNADLAKVRFAPDSDASKVDGLLYSREVYNLSLNADLLVLSSCESGVGKLAQGEGVLSLARSFLYAGARNMVFSLWDVNDTETRKLMETFYTNFLNGQNYREALQKAQQSRIKADKNLPPKHWAGFIMIGD